MEAIIVINNSALSLSCTRRIQSKELEESDIPKDTNVQLISRTGIRKSFMVPKSFADTLILDIPKEYYLVIE